MQNVVRVEAIARARLGQTGGLDLIVQHIQTIGPRQWLSLMAGSIVSNVPVVAPVSQRITRTFPSRSGSFASEDFADGNSA
jgi:hypothetical protein